MFKIAGTLPVKTRLPFVAWALAGLCNHFLASDLVRDSTFNHAEQADTSATGAQYASITDLLKVLAAL